MRAHRIGTLIEIEAPVAAVWDALVDAAAYPQWNPYLTRIEGEIVAGAILIVHASPSDGAPIRYATRVGALEPPLAMQWRSPDVERSRLHRDHWWQLESITPDRTRLRNWQVLSGDLAAGLGRERVEAVRHDFARMNEALRERVEAGLETAQALAAGR